MTDVWQNQWQVDGPSAGRRVVSCFHCSRTIDWERTYNEQLEWIAVPTLLAGGEGDMQRFGMLGRFDASTDCVHLKTMSNHLQIEC